MKAVIVDLDGTLFDTSERFSLCQKEAKSKREFWECYQSSRFMNLDKVNEKVAQLIRELAKKYAIIIVSGRKKETQYDYTVKQLRDNNIPYSEIIMREGNDFSKDYEFKSKAIEQLLSKYEIEIIIDDSEEVRKTIEQKFRIKAIDPN